MRFSILGPLLARADDGSPLGLARPSQRSTLAVLLLRASRPPTRTFLIDALWGDEPPAEADTALRVRMRDLRRALGDSGRLVTHRSGYQMVINPGELDSVTFCDLASGGRAALDSDRPENAARLLSQASALWRDPPLADLPDTPVMRLTRTALLEQRRDVQEWLIDARLALGQHHESLAQIRACIAADPLAEHPHVQLMLALYRAGQKSAALAAYTRLRDLTVREFGQDPGPEARALLSQMLTDSPELRAPARTVTARGAGTAWIPVSVLPAPPPDFTGRGAGVERLARSLSDADVPVTVIAGPPGIGKTALALSGAYRARGAFPDGQLYVALGGRGQPRPAGDIVGELLRLLGVPTSSIPPDVAGQVSLYRSVLADRRVLILADDAASAAQVRPLLLTTAGAAVLVTGNSSLAGLDGAHTMHLAGLSADEAVALLGKIVGERRVAAEPAAAAAIAGACAGSPLALRYVGARLVANPDQRLRDLARMAPDLVGPAAGQAGTAGDAGKLADHIAAAACRSAVGGRRPDTHSARVRARLCRARAQRPARSA